MTVLQAKGCQLTCVANIGALSPGKLEGSYVIDVLDSVKEARQETVLAARPPAELFSCYCLVHKPVDADIALPG